MDCAWPSTVARSSALGQLLPAASAPDVSNDKVRKSCSLRRRRDAGRRVDLVRTKDSIMDPPIGPWYLIVIYIYIYLRIYISINTSIYVTMHVCLQQIDAGRTRESHGFNLV